MHGAPAWPSDFSAPTYANPAAPKGGQLVQGVLGTFDSLNPFIVKGIPAAYMRGYVIESLLARGYDEPFTLYGLLAESVETDDARTYVTFRLNPAARFADGRPVTPADIIFSWETLRDRGRPNFRLYYAKASKVEALDERTVRFDLSAADDRELPLIIGLMPIIAKHAVDPATFEDTSFTPLLGSGPYTVSAVRPGESVTFKRNPNYWGRDLPINRGLWNFDQIRVDYYRDGNTHFEAFKKGLYDVRVETDPGRWRTAYDFPALRDGRALKEEFPYGLPKGMQGLTFNTRRPLFADVRVREALLQLFDFEWINHTYFFDLYKRTASYFDGCDLSAHGHPANARERELLAPFPGTVRDDIMQGTWAPPVTDGSGRDRSTLRRAFALFAEAGYALKGTELVHKASGRPFSFEILTTTRDQERLALAYSRSLKRAGIEARVRTVDATQFERRRIAFDFDMMEYRWEQSLSPGNEQFFYWGSAAADQQGSRNYMGVKSKAVDTMIAAMLSATTREDFVAATRALDRVLLSGFYVIPLYYPPVQWVARWSKIAHPERTSLFGYLPETWWAKGAVQ
ncbi:ABC transporter substrate-binding protein [Pseudolabrys taiwanensis]|uniref:ABC transporter substrate-binding protein n=1 Tax=Pseudolabrys taiwanensis TaxID=331696 RepID=A0A346A3X4_9HYPH|nr:extracellular solute-binding protein [Pseudolabrys taiwanensis]AXK83871.1 ABC transporter substrate-binding protein [Pseudolabrys taiwanensis]